MYVLLTISLGFILAVCRTIGKSLWLPIGFHAAFNWLGYMFITIDDGIYTVHLIIETIIMTIAGFLLLKVKKVTEISPSS